MERQLSNEDTVIGSALLLVRGNDAITSDRRDKMAAYLHAKRAQVRLLCCCCAALELAKPQALPVLCRLIGLKAAETPLSCLRISAGPRSHSNLHGDDWTARS